MSFNAKSVIDAPPNCANIVQDVLSRPVDAPVLDSISPSVSKKFKNNSLEIIFPTVDFPDPIGPTINIFIYDLFYDCVNFTIELYKIVFLIIKDVI